MKIQYDGILFDSELEVEYYKHLCKEKVHFIYHPKVPIKLNAKNNYTPDFIVFYQDRIEIIETKGYSQYSFLKDNMIHNLMLEKSEIELKNWLEQNDLIAYGKVVYKKIKYLKSYGWVDYDFKNPNTIANQRKNKIDQLTLELKKKNQLLHNYERYFKYQHLNKLTKKQQKWLIDFEIAEHKRQLELTTNKTFEKTLKEVKDYE
jgi:hypothetical protein